MLDRSGTHAMGQSVVELQSLSQAVETIYTEIIRTISDDKRDPCIPQAEYESFTCLMDTLAAGKGARSSEAQALDQGINLMNEGIRRGMQFGAMMAAALIAAKGQS